MEINNVLMILLAATAIAATSFSGAILTAKIFKNGYQRYQALMVSFAAGVFVVAGIGVLLEASELMSFGTAVLYALGGVALFHILSLLWPEHHYHHENKDHCHDCSPKSGVARRMLIGDSIHNIVDGMLLVPAFMLGIEFGLFTVLAIWLHEVVQEVSEFVVFKQAGYSTRQALRMNALSAMTIFIGVGIAFFALDLVHDLEGPLLAFASGAFLYIALRDLVPHSVRHTRKNKKYWAHIVAFGLGISLMVATGQIGGHSHGAEDHHDHEIVEEHEVEGYNDHEVDEDHHDHETHDEL